MYTVHDIHSQLRSTSALQYIWLSCIVKYIVHVHVQLIFSALQ